MGVAEHRHQADMRRCLECAVVTVSDTRTEANDHSGKLMKNMLVQVGHRIRFYTILPDDAQRIRDVLADLARRGDIQVILFNGGTGISHRDTTYEAVSALLEKRLDGFGELFRMLSYQEIGPAAMLSRAVAGTCNGKLIFCTPGSTAAVRLAMEKLIVPELPHLVWEVERQRPASVAPCQPLGENI